MGSTSFYDGFLPFVNPTDRLEVEPLKRPIFWGLVLIAVAGAFFFVRQMMTTPTYGLHVGDLAPPFTMKTVTGQTVSLSSLKGQPVLLNFFASWCGPCKQEMPALQKIHEAWGGKAIIYGIDLTAEEPNQKPPLDFLRQEAVTYPILLDTTGAVAVGYSVVQIPTTVVLDKNGRVVEIISQASTYKTFEAALTTASQ